MSTTRMGAGVLPRFSYLFFFSHVYLLWLANEKSVHLMSYFYDSMSKRGEPIHGHISKEDETASAELLDIPGSRGRTPVHAQHCATKHTPPLVSSASCFYDN